MLQTVPSLDIWRTNNLQRFPVGWALPTFSKSSDYEALWAMPTLQFVAYPIGNRCKWVSHQRGGLPYGFLGVTESSYPVAIPNEMGTKNKHYGVN